ncbi:hypothetical protein CFT12S00416_07905 [Campylobacter fetus subsp. testudinum]|uniref:hypothetical protein n=1 Tax=Campylobacter fetus TaxID=196 RepID=UPI000818B05C|nr:hypothetical protein [Campylobacter fetus]OCR87741.1 hypothetical protein CFT12S00416_07905 [Campylobacter fetus subsp. testudinum]OCR98911.1 hypothetical protein A9K75_09325 [Campylobacter fetus subsp. testudinum]
MLILVNGEIVFESKDGEDLDIKTRSNHISGNGNISVNGNENMITGQVYRNSSQNITIEIDGNIGDLNVDSGNVIIKGNSKNIKVDIGNIEVQDTVAGNAVTKMGSIKAHMINGNAKTENGEIKCHTNRN